MALEEIASGAGTAVADGAGAGSGDGAGAGDGAGTGGDGGAGTGTEVVTEGEGAGAGEGAGEGTGEGEGEGTGEGELPSEEESLEGIEADGRKVDLKTREALTALKKTNPAAAKVLSDTYHRAQAIVKDVGAENLSQAVDKVRQMAATMEAVGGEEGVTELQGEVEDYRNEIKQFSEGDPALLTQLHEANPESFGTAISNGLELLASKSPELFDKALLPSLISRLDKAGMFTTVKQLAELIKEGKGQESYDLTLKLSDWLDKAKNLASKQIEMRSKKDPEREALERDRAKLDSDKREAYENTIATDVNRQNNLVTARIVEPFFKELKLKPEGRREFVNSLNQRIWAKMKSDAPFQRAAKAIMAKGDAVRTARFTHAKFSELLPLEFRALRNAMYPNYMKGGTKVTPVKKEGASAASGNGAAAGGAAGVKVNYTGGKPNRDDVDWAKTNDTFWIAGRAFLKSGKEVRWDWKGVK